MAFESPIQQALHHYPITLALVVICIGVFALQLFFGVNPTNPTNQSLIAWGANFLPFSLGEAPWRLMTSLFLHIGFMHLLFNMFALYYFGQVAERMFGAVNFLALFLLSGVGGNLLNNFLGLHSVMAGEPPIISAGASGGIMGIGMALLVTALTKTSFNNFALNFRSLLQGLDGNAPALKDGVQLGSIAGVHSVGLGKVVLARNRELAKLEPHLQPNDGTVFVHETQLAAAKDHIIVNASHTGLLINDEVAMQIHHFLQQGHFLHTKNC